MNIDLLRDKASVISIITGFKIIIGNDYSVKIFVAGDNIYSPADPKNARELYLFLEGMHTMIITQRFYQEPNQVF